MFAFNRVSRLLRKSDYDHVFEQAKKLVTSDFVMLYRENTIGHARLGLALSKKKVAKAHDRNRLKRMLRESFRTHHLPPIDVIVLARHGVINVQNKLIFDELHVVWGKFKSRQPVLS